MDQEGGMVVERVNHYDIVIAGGGMIGSCLALALAPLGLRVAMVEAVARAATRQPSFDERSTALSRSSQRMFTAMGLWPEIAAASTPIAKIHVSDRGRFGFSHIDASEQGVEALGYVVINRVLGNVLQNALSSVAGLDLLCPARIVDVRVDVKPDIHAADAPVAVTVDEGGVARELTCSLLVAADGANSTVRELLGIQAVRTDYKQCAVIGNVLPEIPPAHRAYERFTPDGPLALLPVTENRCAFVWSLSCQDADEVMQLGDEAFTLRLQASFGYRLGRFAKTGQRAAYPLAQTRALRLTARRSVLVGNSANGLHPVAAQGFNLGMRDVAALCDGIADVLAEGRDRSSIGDDDVLHAYAEWRRPDHRKVMRFTDGLVRLFGSERMPLRVLRDAGMLAFDMVPGIRSLFARHTMGLAGRLPRLSRGVPLA